MRANVFVICCIIIPVLCSCGKKEALNADLLEIERLIEIDTDSAQTLLNNYIASEKALNRLDHSYYNVLLAAIDSKNKRLSPVNDSLLDVSIKYFKRNRHHLSEAKAWLYKGKVWNTLHMDEDALNYYYKALEILEYYPDYDTQTKVYNDLGDIYLNQEFYDKASSMYHNAYTCDSIQGNQDYMILSLCDLARLSLFQGNPDEYERYIEKAYRLAGQTKHPEKHMSNLDYFYSIYFFETGNYNSALNHISKSIINDSNKKPFSKYLVKGEAFYELHQYDSAQHYLSMSASSDDIYTQTASYYELFRLYQSQENLQEAINHLLNYQTGADSIAELTYKSESQALIYKYDVEKAVLKANAKNKARFFVLTSLFIILLLGLFLFFLWRDKKMKLKQNEKEKEILNNEKEILKKEKEIRILRNEMVAFQKSIFEYQKLKDKLNEYQYIIEYKEKELFILLERDIEVQCNKFKTKHIYKKIVALSGQTRDKDVKILTYKEQDELFIELNSAFTPLINELKESFAFLSNEDLTLCCLSVLRLSTYAISLCFTVSGPNTIKQRRHRIKTKMAEVSDGSYLHDFIFLNKKNKISDSR